MNQINLDTSDPYLETFIQGLGDLTGDGGGLPLGEQEGSDGAIAEAPLDERRVVSRELGTGKNQLLQFQEGKWSKSNNNKLKDPEWTFDHICGLRLGPRGWPQLDGTYQHIWPLNSIREADHLMPYSTPVASSPEDTRRYSNQSIIHLSRKLFYHLPTEKRFCILESSNG
ncbi:unnamed protein product [Arctogadus glacialis]